MFGDHFGRVWGPLGPTASGLAVVWGPLVDGWGTVGGSQRPPSPLSPIGFPQVHYFVVAGRFCIRIFVYVSLVGGRWVRGPWFG